MEDPWLNAWHDPLKLSPHNPPQSISSSKFVTDDQADIGLPSWDSSDAAPTWSSDSTDLHDELWTRENRTSQLWTTPTLESIGFAKPPEDPQFSNDSPCPPSPQHSDQERERTPETVIISATSLEEDEASPVRPVLPEGFKGFGEKEKEGGVQREASPDPEGFGTFTNAFDDHTNADPWTPSHSIFPQTEETGDWGTTWKDQSESVDNDDVEPVDEWELAKRQKENQDRYVPPAFLNSILRHYDEFAGDYWPEQQSEEASGVYQHNHEDLAKILGITSIIERLIPSDTSLSIPTAFMKTFTSKEMIETLKLTRHHIITRQSPLAVYMNTKGSLSWEAAVKSTPDITEADVVPTGWRILPKENVDQQQSTNDTKKKTTGSLLSFFGRKSASASSPVRSSTPTSGSPRPSTDIVSAITPSVAKPASPAFPKEVDAAAPATMSATVPVSETSHVIESRATAESEEPAQSSSVVSRILGRFSRSNKSANSNSRNSIALSSNDLEFLSDIVPSACDDVDELDSLNELSDKLHPPPVPTKLPPLLAPPPRASSFFNSVTPPPIVTTRPAAEQGLSSASLGPTQVSRSNQYPDALSSQSPLESTSKPQFASVLTPSRPRSSAAVVPTLPPPLSPTPSRSNTPTVKPSTNSLFNDEFSDFQTSPASPSVSQPSIDPFLSSFTASSSAGHSRSAQTHSFDDFNDFVSCSIAETPNTIPAQHQSITSSSPSPPVPPPKRSQHANLHERRFSRQADSDQRALNLLEVAAARGKWPAPPSPLPNAIAPPPQTNKTTASNLLDMFEEKQTTVSTVQLANTTKSDSRNPLPSPPPNAIMMNGSAADDSLGRSIEISGATSTVPLIPMRQSMQPVEPARGLNQSQAVKQQWRVSSPTARSLNSLTPLPETSSPSLFDFGDLTTNQNRSSTPVQLSQQQQKPVMGAFSSLASLSASAPDASSSSQRNTSSSGGGKLSAQDLSFFEGL
ncbi:hypothetical protein AGABI1DRAFT_126162 [Agaricus bisporus var. burnettii JB137-S8]|uniref:Uncharacterized protein n=1 Tax=Agaricus bisporus var. burnettii (strain JB137-S8 / ATCC MYA-4627 / FGSC 10392) TaxID=597362 RepID=K5XEJ9_AGABU|nr:uncharacterized protein AGABI1DRAFT_126162 [Agaricus bisporus var. burnettii JB137-S8]EKM81808.1 hypothetical protein AGABI1DRAFT_126162 [Agaricus bisporus var. burnettii JB137-S8]